MEKKFEFDEAKIKKVSIDEVSPNTWNPKADTSPKYDKIKQSLEVNGYAQPIMVREKDGGYEIIDGYHRYKAALELGYSEIYVYDEGVVSDEDAKAMTIFMQTQVPFDKIMLAPLALELKSMDIELPFTDREIQGFEKIVNFEEKETDHFDDELKTLKIRMTPDQFETVNGAIDYITSQENVSEGRALELLVASGLAGYPFDSTAEDFE